MERNPNDHLKALLAEDKRYAQLAKVFGDDDGLDVLEWLIDQCGYWTSEIKSDRALGKFDLGRYIFNQICIADVRICYTLLDRRRKLAESVRQREKQQIENRFKGD